MHKNLDMFEKYTYLCIADAIERVCDEELVYEMLTMLNSSIESDWSAFETFLNEKKYTLAANVLHGMKGTIPIFSNSKTAEFIQKTEIQLNSVANEIELNELVKDLRSQMLGFMAELKQWTKDQNQD